MHIPDLVDSNYAVQDGRQGDSILLESVGAPAVDRLRPVAASLVEVASLEPEVVAVVIVLLTVELPGLEMLSERDWGVRIPFCCSPPRYVPED